MLSHYSIDIYTYRITCIHYYIDFERNYPKYFLDISYCPLTYILTLSFVYFILLVEFYYRTGLKIYCSEISPGGFKKPMPGLSILYLTDMYLYSRMGHKLRCEWIT